MAFGGVIDDDFQGNVHVLLFNHGSEAYEILEGEKIAQLLVLKYENPRVVEHKSWVSGSMKKGGNKEAGEERGERGFGSSGVF